MDPVSTAASVLSIAQIALLVTSALVKYARDTQHASTEKTLLVEEASSLSRMLERLRDRAEGASLNDEWLDDRKDLIRQFQRAYEDLAKALKFNVSTGQLTQDTRLKTILSLTK